MRKKTLFAVAVLVWSAHCAAQSYPIRPITLVVPTPAGGAADALARSLAESMGKRLGQTIIVDNKPGAGGILAVQMVTRAAPDGYTLLITHSAPIISTPLLYANVPYDVRRDLAFISEISTARTVLAVNREVPAKTVPEFLAWAAGNRGKVSYGSYGTGSFGHLAGAYLNHSRRLDMTHIAYKGEAPMVQALIGGHISWAIGTVKTLEPHLQSGRLRALAILGSERAEELPNVPTMIEAGIADQELKPLGWMGLMARAGTPAPILSRLESEARAAVQSIAMRERLRALSLEPVGSTSAQFRREFESAEPVVERLIKLSGAKAE